MNLFFQKSHNYEKNVLSSDGHQFHQYQQNNHILTEDKILEKKKT